MQTMLAATVTADDVILFCSLTGRNSELLKTATIAGQYGATTIGLTVGDSPLAKTVDVPLTAALENDREVLRPNSMRYGFLMLINVLAHLVASHRGRSGQEIIRHIREQLLA